MQTSAIQVRKARAADAERLAVIFAASWRLAYRGIIPHLHLERLVELRGPAWWTKSLDASGGGALALELAGEIGGYATVGRSRWPLSYKGEIYELYMAPEYQGVGLGEHLFEGARHLLDQHRLKGLLVWALTENEGACDFYRRRGGRPVARSHESYGSTKVPKLAFGWP